MLIQILLGFILAVLFGLVGTPMAREAALKFGVVDAPSNPLKKQSQPVPYLGGLAIYMAFLLSLGMTASFDQEVLGLLLSASIVSTLGLIDDFGVLTPKAKILGQLVAVFVLVKSGIALGVVALPPGARLALTVLWLVGLSNAFNLVDIMDGLAGSLGVISAGFLLVIAIATGKLVVAAFTVALVGALIGFLRFNLPPASIYMGDSGSLFLGLTLGALAMVLDYTRSNPVGWVAPLFFLALPIADTLYVSVLRIKAGRRIWHGSPDHFPLRLKRKLGGSVLKTVLVSNLVALILGAIGLFIVFVADERATWIAVGVTAAAGFALLWWLAGEDMEQPERR